MPQMTSFPDELSPSDRLMWTIERDPVLRSPITTIGLLDRDPDWQAVRATFERAIERLPRFRQIVTATGVGGRRLRWVDDTTFSLDYHVRRMRVARPADMRAVLDLASPNAVAAFDPARPLWEFTVVEGMEGGRAAFILRFHHTITDGVGGVDLASVVFDRTRGGTRVTNENRDAGGPDAPVADRSGNTVLKIGRAGAKAFADPAGTIRSARRFRRSVAKMLAPVPEPLSPVFLGRGLDRRLDMIELPMAGMRAAAKAAGCTINDVFLAAVGGGLHEYHQRLGFSVPALRFTMPISVRAEGDPPGGNHFTPARFILPIDDPSPAERARIAREIAQGWRKEPAVGLTQVLAATLNQLPAGVVTHFFGSMLKNIDVDAVDVPGLTRPAYVGGARIDRLWAFAPPTGSALSVTLLSHLDTCCVGVLSDLAAVPDPSALVACLEEGFDEVLALGVPVAAQVGA